MAAFIYLASADKLDEVHPDHPGILLESSAEYWFLYRYFEGANLDKKHELVDLYGGGVIEGYQLHRLRCELEQALADVALKPDEWKVLIGWKGRKQSLEAEHWETADKAEVTEIVGTLLELIDKSSTQNLKLVCSGD